MYVFDIKLIWFLFFLCVTILLFGVFLNLIKPDEVGKPIANETSQQLWHYEEFSSLYLTLIDRKPASFITKLEMLKHVKTWKKAISKFHFPVKLYEIWKKVLIQNYFLH